MREGRAALRPGSIGWLALATAVVVLAPSSLASHPSVILHPPFSGAASPTTSQVLFGCSKIPIDKPWLFKVGTGFGTTSIGGSATACKSVLRHIGETSGSSLVGTDQIAMNLKLPSGTTHLSVNTADGFQATLKASEGLKNATCGPGLDSSYTGHTRWTWNWNGSAFGNAANNDTYLGSGFWTYFANNTTGLPAPFNLTPNDSYSLSLSYGVDRTCQSSSFASFNTTLSVVDLSSGATFPANGTNLPGGCTGCGGSSVALNEELIVENTTDWSCTVTFDWNGPTNTTTGSTSPTCSNLNQTLTSELIAFVPGSSSTSCGGAASAYHCSFSNTTGAANWTNSTTSSGITWFNDTFVKGHHYALFAQIEVVGFAFQCWPNGTASFSLNVLSPGHGFRVVSVVAT